MILYHATDWDGSGVFDMARLGQNTDGNTSELRAALAHIGVWFHGQPSVVRDATGAETELVCRVRIITPYYAESLDALAWRISEEGGADAFVRKMHEDGYDGVAVEDEEFGGTSYVVFSPSQFRVIKKQ